jgi:hypothetical protein
MLPTTSSQAQRLSLAVNTINAIHSLQRASVVGSTIIGSSDSAQAAARPLQRADSAGRPPVPPADTERLGLVGGGKHGERTHGDAPPRPVCVGGELGCSAEVHAIACGGGSGSSSGGGGGGELELVHAKLDLLLQRVKGEARSSPARALVTPVWRGATPTAIGLQSRRLTTSNTSS